MSPIFQKSASLKQQDYSSLSEVKPLEDQITLEIFRPGNEIIQKVHAVFGCPRRRSTLKDRSSRAVINLSDIIARLRPMQTLGPFENGIKSSLISSETSPCHRSGRRTSEAGNAVGLRCVV